MSTAEIALRVIATVLGMSFACALVAMVYDATSPVGLNNRAAKLVAIAYLCPTAVVGIWVFVTGIRMLWGYYP